MKGHDSEFNVSHMPDLTIYGAGIFGLSTAWACMRRGASVQVIDPNGVAAGASGGILGALAPHTPENWNDKKAFQFESLMMAEAFWAGVAQTGGGDPGYSRIGRLQPVADDAALALANTRAEAAQTLWQGRAKWEVISVSAARGLSPPSPTGLLIHDTLSARLHPARACAALADALRANGVRVLSEGTATGAVLWATGVDGLADISAALNATVGNGVKGQAALLAADLGDQPQLFLDGVHIVAHNDGTVAVGSTSERDFDAPDTTDAQLDVLLARATEAIPRLADARVVQRWAGVRPRARSRAPMLGAWPDRPGHFIANGGFKIGFGMAPKIAEVMADLILEGRDTIPDEFRFRASLPASAR